MVNYYDYVKSHPEEFKQFSCKELLFLIIDCPPDFTKAEDWAEHNCFLYVITGNHIVYSRERSWLLQQGATVFMKKGGCGIEKVDEETFCALMFYVPDSYIQSFARENASLFPRIELSMVTGDLVLPVNTTDVLTSFYESVISYFTSGTQPPEDLLELKFRELLLNIITNSANKELTAYFYKLFLTNTVDLPDIMDRNCCYALELHDYARLCHRSLSSFKRDFQTVYGTPPGHWLHEKRLGKARHLLVTSDISITDIAVDSGFKNYTHFSRAFKNHFGVSPLQCRKQVAAITAHHS